MNKAASPAILFRIVWGLVIIGSFFILPFWWALGIALYLAVLSPLFGAIAGKAFNEHERVRLGQFLSGVAEALVFILVVYLIGLKFADPKWLLLVAAAEYTANQLARAYGEPLSGANKQELRELSGFLIILIAWAIIRFAF